MSKDNARICSILNTAFTAGRIDLLNIGYVNPSLKQSASPRKKAVRTRKT
jgi:hypothetical protein